MGSGNGHREVDVCLVCNADFYADEGHSCPAAQCGNRDAIRTFDTGATRDTDEGKPRYHAYTCSLVEQKRGEYMLKHQKQGDTIRPADNWKKRMPLEEILESLIRHVKDLELHHDGYVDQCRESDVHEILGGIWANATFYHHGICQDERKERK